MSENDQDRIREAREKTSVEFAKRDNAWFTTALKEPGWDGGPINIFCALSALQPVQAAQNDGDRDGRTSCAQKNVKVLLTDRLAPLIIVFRKTVIDCSIVLACCPLVRPSVTALQL